MDESTEALAAIVRRIVARELDILDKLVAMSDDDVDRLSKLALTLQRVRVPAAGGVPVDPSNPATSATNETLFKKAQV